MAVHDLDMSRFLAGADPIDILAIGSCHIDKSIEVLDGSEKFDTANCIVRYPNGVQAMIDVCRQSSYGYDQRAEVLGTGGMIATDNVYPNTAKIYKNGKTDCNIHSLWNNNHFDSTFVRYVYFFTYKIDLFYEKKRLYGQC